MMRLTISTIQCRDGDEDLSCSVMQTLVTYESDTDVSRTHKHQQTLLSPPARHDSRT